MVAIQQKGEVKITYSNRLLSQGLTHRTERRVLFATETDAAATAQVAVLVQNAQAVAPLSLTEGTGLTVRDVMAAVVASFARAEDNVMSVMEKEPSKVIDFHMTTQMIRQVPNRWGL